MSNCWAWGVQQRLARSECAEPTTRFARCCREANVDGRDLLKVPKPGEEPGDGPCRAELEVLRRCVPGALIGGQGRAFEACARDFKAVAALPEDADAQKAAAVLHRGWSCVMRGFTQPIEQLVAQAQAVGECRPAVPVKNTSGKGAWTA
ncbi:unnamed protein product [Effrenium voratum]|uniref:Uncharacterized protein n=1 Tax=Effrenium voratum TaxID=2562239 RepID=A0AA36I2P1_9DINO|nr:unnamed protein product [Effrenium voratum]